MRKGLTLTECLVAILIISIIALIIFSTVSFALVSTAMFSNHSDYGRFINFCMNELLIRGVKDDSITSVGNFITKKFHNLPDNADLSSVYPKIQSISVKSETFIPRTNVRSARVLEVTIIKDFKGNSETLLVFQGRP